MTRGRYGWICALALMPALAGCESDPYHIGPMLVGVVRLDAALADASGTPIGTQTVTNADGVRVWLIEAGRAVDSTLTIRGVYTFSVTRGHSYRTQFGVRPAFVDSSELIIATRDAAFDVDTLRLGRAGDLASRPNPFATQVALSFQLGNDTHVEIAVYDLSANRVRALASRAFPAGSHVLSWDGTDDATHEVGDGMYWVLLQTAKETRAELIVKQRNPPS